MELQTERLKLTPCTIESLLTYSTKEYELGPHIGMYLEKLKRDTSVLGWGVWLVIDKQTNKIIGDIGFKGKPNEEKSVEVGYGITSSKQNKGYATEGLKCIIEWAFNSDSVNKIMAKCFEDNTPSIKVLEKLKMTKIKRDNGMLYWQLNK
ncbi:GNAT family N-acetyltransferase [Ferdinandcohnia quinoae]|uniref:GNAT family N-acetyltransferase n=1 Tax=Fredinandcohnia quinoae TaxID=2918902 RepID=A0AAW5E225_9BACI|nr:GNAT family N-acetyltransferase [Fredinandcohnia sp. SECRCQ15]MCH1625325.1 GNAT family N-acetyltransferase [Fredinandcohnia sp. SECRCQ15]